MSDIDLLVVALKAQAVFVLGKIPKSEKVRFAAEMNSIIESVQSSIDFAHADKTVRNNANNVVDKNFFIRIFHNPVPIQRLAYGIAQDVLDSYKVRFIDGGSKLYLGLLEEKFKLVNK